MSAGAAAGAARVRAEKAIVAALREAGATSPDQAAPLAVPKRWMQRRALDRLIRWNVVHDAGGRYWLDESRWDAVRSARRRTAALALVAAGALIAIVAALSAARGG